ncbi:MAG: 2-hydroxychromene-2-carboxylate isomerase [Pseudomonadota bacterium]
MIDIDFYYDFGSPNAYVAHRTLPPLAERHGVALNWHPILLGGLFKITQNQPPMIAFKDVPLKISYMNQQMARFLMRHQIDFAWNPHFPVMTTTLMRGAIFSQGKNWEARYIDEMFQAVWVEKLKMDDPSVIVPRLAQAGLPADEIAAATQDDAVKKALFAATEAAKDRGAFGSPAMFVGAEQFFGKDSLDDLDWYLGNLASGAA